MKVVKDILRKVHYVLDPRSRRLLPWLFLIILGGAFAELIGVSIVLPIINLAVDPNEVYQNRYCRILASALGLQTAEQIMIVLIVATIIIYITKNIYLVIMNNTMYRFTMSVQRKMAVRLMTSYTRQPYAFFLTRNTSEIIRSINSDTENFREVIINVLMILSNALLCLIILAYLLKTSPVITLVVVCVLAVCFLGIFFHVNRRMRRMGKEKQILEGQILKTLQETFHGIKEIKILNRDSFFINRFDREYAKKAEVGRKANLYSILPKYLIEAVAITAVMLCLIGTIALKGNYGSIVGQLAVFAVAAFKLLPAANAIYAYFSTVMFHRASIDLVYQDIYEADQLNRKNDLADISEKGDFSFEHQIEVSHIGFAYENSSEDVLRDADFTIQKGEAIGIMGKSGAGKTTIVDILLGLLKPRSGRVLVDQKDITTNYTGWLSHIGYIPQSIFLADTSIKENIAFGQSTEEIDEDAVKRAVEEAQLGEFIASLPDGIDTIIGEDGVRLSGGQRQRIGIARALYTNPELLVLDEATSALDNETEKAVMEAIDHLHGMKTLIIIAHRLSTITNCDKVIEITDGIAVERNPKELM